MGKKKTEIAEELTIDTNSIAEIKKLPIFYLSLSSKELFHSNFLFWLSKSDTGIKILGDLFQVNGLKYFIREKGGNKLKGEKIKTPKADLAGYDSENKLVLLIENKVKDIPNEKQIELLRKSFGTEIKIIILSFIEPKFIYREPVSFISYEKLQEALSTSIDKFSSNIYYYELIKDYVRLLTYLNNIVKSFRLSGNYDFALNVRPKLFKSLNEIKLWENYQRVAGQDFALRVAEILERIPEFNGFLTNSSVNHQKATINFSFRWNNFEIGIQIENNHFRRFIYGKITRDNADKLRKQNIWFDESWKPKRKLKELENNDIEYEDGIVKYSYYGSYDMKESGLFLYQYNPSFATDCNKNITDIANMIINDLNILFSKDNKKLIESTMSLKNSV